MSANKLGFSGAIFRSDSDHLYSYLRLAENKFEFKEKETDLLVHKILLEEVPW